MNNIRAISLVLVAMVFWSTQDVLVKFTADQVSLWQMQIIRSGAILFMIFGILWGLGRRQDFTPVRWRWPFVRALFMCTAYLAFYASLPYISLAKAASAFFISPILITVLAAVFLGEGIGPRRLIAVFVGFAGVLCIVQPGLDGWTPVTLLPVGAAGCYAAGVILTRWRCREDPGFSLTMVNGLVNGAVGLLVLLLLPVLQIPEDMRAEHVFVLSGWFDLAPLLLGLVLLTAVTHIVGALASVTAYQIGEASRLAPFEYVYLVFMGLFGYAIWGTVPEPGTMIGMALICGSGGFIAWREGRPPRPRVQQNAEIPWTPERFDESPSTPEASLEVAPSRSW